MTSCKFKMWPGFGSRSEVQVEFVVQSGFEVRKSRCGQSLKPDQKFKLGIQVESRIYEKGQVQVHIGFVAPSGFQVEVSNYGQKLKPDQRFKSSL